MKHKTYKTKTLTAIRRRVRDACDHYTPWGAELNRELLRVISETLGHERIETQKAILGLIEGETRRQVAERLGCSRQAIDKKVNRLRATLGERLLEIGAERKLRGEILEKGCATSAY